MIALTLRDTLRLVAMAFLLSATWVLVSCSRADLTAEEANVRHPAVAGQFYPADRRTLSRDIEEMLEAAPPAVAGRVVRGIIAPHAGYQFSGQVAAAAFKCLEGSRVRRVVLLGPTHRVGFSGVAAASFSAYRTPLGDVELDRELIDELVRSDGFREYDQAHLFEHSLEVEVPFLQKVLGEFLLVPLVVGSIDPGEYDTIGAAIRRYLDDQTVIVASSDFTHYGARFGYVPFRDDVRQNLRKLNSEAFEHIIALDVDGFLKYLDETGNSICGARPIAILMAALANQEVTGKLVDYYASGDVTGDWSDCVCYASIVFTAEAPSPDRLKQKAEEVPALEDEDTQASGELAMAGVGAESSEEGVGVCLSDDEKRTLLALARDAVETFVRSGEKIDPYGSKYRITDRLKQDRGAFVTLKIAGNLRGCIGYIEGVGPLCEAVRDNAINAAARDPRFSPVEPAELGRIEIEVSAMTPLVKVADVDEIEVGRHGLVIEKGFYKGLLLPQVATEWGWDREEFLQHTCRKAGLPPDAWKTGATIYRFEAEVFSEQSMGIHNQAGR